MFFKHLLLAVLISLLLTGVFIFWFRKRGPWNSFLIFFIVVVLGAWAGGIWFPEVGPAIWGVHCLSFLIVGLIISLLLVASMSSTPRNTTVQLMESGERETETKKRLVLGVYFWLMVIALVVLITTRYF